MKIGPDLPIEIKQAKGYRLKLKAKSEKPAANSQQRTAVFMRQGKEWKMPR